MSDMYLGVGVPSYHNVSTVSCSGPGKMARDRSTTNAASIVGEKIVDRPSI